LNATITPKAEPPRRLQFFFNSSVEEHVKLVCKKTISKEKIEIDFIKQGKEFCVLQLKITGLVVGLYLIKSALVEMGYKQAVSFVFPLILILICCLQHDGPLLGPILHFYDTYITTFVGISFGGRG
jgi:hypothetical protein